MIEDEADSALPSDELRKLLERGLEAYRFFQDCLKEEGRQLALSIDMIMSWFLLVLLLAFATRVFGDRHSSLAFVFPISLLVVSFVPGWQLFVVASRARRQRKDAQAALHQAIEAVRQLQLGIPGTGSSYERTLAPLLGDQDDHH